MKMFKIIVILTTCQMVSAINYREAKAMRRREFEGKIKNTHILPTVATAAPRSLPACNMRCLEDESCSSYFYNHETKACQLHTIVFYNVVTTVPQAGSAYYQLYNDWCSPEDGHNLYRPLNVCYKFYVQELLNFDQATSFCNGRSELLLTIRDGTKFNHIITFLLDIEIGIWQQFFTSARNDTGILLWPDNTPVTYTNFPVGEPSSAFENCVTLHRIYGYLWNDTTCNTGYRIICEHYKQ